ncbi:hypothetical protein KCP77_15200 [Salmonella enterica subsp. enterica]|nr:hypothetical protein KCP77_15200 [Salmonella enterica subsp. enterica]
MRFTPPLARPVSCSPHVDSEDHILALRRWRLRLHPQNHAPPAVLLARLRAYTCGKRTNATGKKSSGNAARLRRIKALRVCSALTIDPSTGRSSSMAFHIAPPPVLNALGIGDAGQIMDRDARLLKTLRGSKLPDGLDRSQG